MKKAFSLMELMVVIIILGLLTAFVLPDLISKGEESKDKITCSQMASLSGTLDMYKLDNSVYPETEEGLSKLAEKNYYKNGKLPKDSWQNDFIYILNDKDNFELISFGADKKEGTEDDIYFSKCDK